MTSLQTVVVSERPDGIWLGIEARIHIHSRFLSRHRSGDEHTPSDSLTTDHGEESQIERS